MVNVFEIPHTGERGCDEWNPIDPVTSAARTKPPSKVARVHVKKGEVQKLKLPFARPSEWVEESTEHSIYSSERRECILHVRFDIPAI